MRRRPAAAFRATDHLTPENLADTRTLYKIGTGFIDLFCRSYTRPPMSIVLDIGDTDDMVHGQRIARVLAHVIHRMRRQWPKVAILVRGDGHYCAPEVLDLPRQRRCNYILALSRNKALDALAELWREQCRRRWKPGLKVRRFHQVQ